MPLPLAIWGGGVFLHWARGWPHPGNYNGSTVTCLHICDICWQKDRKQCPHPESAIECPHNKQWLHAESGMLRNNLWSGLFGPMQRFIPAKVYLCGFEHLNKLHIHTLWIYFLTDYYQNSMFCSLASIPSRDYEKSHRLKQRSLIEQPSLRTAVNQACPPGRIQGWYSGRSVATPR